MSERTKKFAGELDKLIKDGEFLSLAMDFECYPKEFRESYLKAFEGDKEKLENYIQKIPSFGDEYQKGILRRRPSLNRLYPIDWLTSFPTSTFRRAGKI